MTIESMSRGRRSSVLAAVIGSVLASYAGGASALDWEFDNGARLAWNTTLAVGASWRVNGPDKELYHRADGELLGLTNGLGGSRTDSNTLNYGSGDRFSTPFTLVTDLELKKNQFGILVRAKAWYDQALEDEKVRYGHQNNGYNGTIVLNGGLTDKFPCTGVSAEGNALCMKGQWPQAKLNDKGFEDEVKFSNVYLLDAYVYGSFALGSSDLQLRLGNQVVNWGESLFIQGINQINPIDVPAARRPGTQLKEVLLPVWMAYANWGFNWGSVEAFYQFKWENTALDTCGLYWGPAEGVVGTNPAGCGSITSFGGVGGGSNPVNQAAGIYFPAKKGKDASDSGIWGASLRFPVSAIDTEFGLYYMNIHSQIPNVSSYAGTVPEESIVFPAALGGSTLYDAETGLWQGGFINPFQTYANYANLLGYDVESGSGFWEYTEDRQIFGLSAATNLWGWSFSAEASYQMDVPAQVEGNDVIAAALRAIGPVRERALASRADRAAGGDGYLRGYDLFDVTQFQVNTIKTFSNIPLVKADTGLLIAEVGFRWNNLPDYKKGGLRYNRAFIYGLASGPDIANQTGVSNACPSELAPGVANPFYNTQPDGCKNDGYATDFSWGYRIRWTMDYLNMGGSGITMRPKIFWSHDVDGYSINPQFIEDRQTLGLGVDFIYNKRYNVGVDYTYYGDTAYNPLFDRDFVSVTASVTF
jgi:hypothetical protein